MILLKKIHLPTSFILLVSFFSIFNAILCQTQVKPEISAIKKNQNLFENTNSYYDDTDDEDQYDLNSDTKDNESSGGGAAAATYTDLNSQLDEEIKKDKKSEAIAPQRPIVKDDVKTEVIVEVEKKSQVVPAAAASSSAVETHDSKASKSESKITQKDYKEENIKEDEYTDSYDYDDYKDDKDDKDDNKDEKETEDYDTQVTDTDTKIDLPKEVNQPAEQPKTDDSTRSYETSGAKLLNIITKPGILAGIIGGAIIGVLTAILLIMFIVYRMRKKDEGSYALEETKKPLNAYDYRNCPTREFYA